MKTLFGHLLILTCLPGVHSAEQLLQSDSAIVRPGSSYTLTCTGSEFSLSSYWMYWIRQVPGKGLQYLCQIHGTTTYYSDAIKSRFIISRDDSKNMVSLQMNNMNTDDNSMYYCARDNWYTFDLWGQGTMVTVTAASPLAPSLFPLISCGMSEKQSTIIGCLARNFLPGSVDFSWRDQNNSSSSEEDFKTKIKNYTPLLQPDGTYVTSCQVPVPTNSWENSDPYYCTAKHPQGDKTVKVLKINGGSRKPIVTIHPPVREDVETNNNATIVCIVSGFYPDKIEIKWQKNHNGPLKATMEGPVSDENGGFIMTSNIVVSKNEWDKDDIFSCIVNHSASDFYEIKNMSKSSACDPYIVPGAIKVTAIPPLFETIYMQNIAPLTCIISNMGEKDGLEVAWYTGNEKLHTEIEDPIFDSSTQKYNAKAIATVCPEDWKTKTFECRVSHPELPNVVVYTLSKPNGHDARPPTVLAFPPHQDELAKKETATMSCMVKGFSPSDIFVKWIDSDNVEQSNVITTQPMEEISSSSKKTYFLYSTLTLTNLESWNSGKAYTCIVGHESLPLYTVQKTIDKASGKPTNMNVSFIMSETC